MTHQDLCRIKDDATRAAARSTTARQRSRRRPASTTAWFRTPYGVRCERVDAMLAERHLTHFHWDLDPQEWKHNNAKKTFDYVDQAARRR